MNRSTTVFILGAGCSAKCGYPLGVKLADQLQEFPAKIPSGCPTIVKAVHNTVSLVASWQVETLDELAKRGEEEFSSYRRKEGSVVWNQRDQKEENQADERILDAKIATAALFLDREQEARKTGLQSYKRLIASLFGGSPWEEGVRTSHCHVLTFNYDRLLELAFLDHFKDFERERSDLYWPHALNSGFNKESREIEPAADKFCFLKLHGSAGWWVKKDRDSPERRRYGHELLAPITMQNIETRLQKREGEIYSVEPLVAFPHEKQRFTSKNPGNFAQGPYIEKIWQCAASILADAESVRVIGYSFNPIDSRHMVNNLLSKAKACEKIVIQNTDVDGVRSALESYRAQLKPLEFDPTPF